MILTMILAVAFAASNQSFLKDKLTNNMSLNLSTSETESTDGIPYDVWKNGWSVERQIEYNKKISD